MTSYRLFFFGSLLGLSAIGFSQETTVTVVPPRNILAIGTCGIDDFKVRNGGDRFTTSVALRSYFYEAQNIIILETSSSKLVLQVPYGGPSRSWSRNFDWPGLNQRRNLVAGISPFLPAQMAFAAVNKLKPANIIKEGGICEVSWGESKGGRPLGFQRTYTLNALGYWIGSKAALAGEKGTTLLEQTSCTLKGETYTSGAIVQTVIGFGPENPHAYIMAKITNVRPLLEIENEDNLLHQELTGLKPDEEPH